MAGARATGERPWWTHIHTRALRAFAGFNRVATVARSYRWQRKIHHFLDTTSAERFSLDNHAVELLHHGTLPARFGAARLLSRLIRSAQLNFGCGLIALDDDDRFAIGSLHSLTFVRRNLLRYCGRDRDQQQQRPPLQMPAYHW